MAAATWARTQHRQRAPPPHARPLTSSASHRLRAAPVPASSRGALDDVLSCRPATARAAHDDDASRDFINATLRNEDDLHEGERLAQKKMRERWEGFTGYRDDRHKSVYSRQCRMCRRLYVLSERADCPQCRKSQITGGHYHWYPNAAGESVASEHRPQPERLAARRAALVRRGQGKLMKNRKYIASAVGPPAVPQADDAQRASAPETPSSVDAWLKQHAAAEAALPARRLPPRKPPPMAPPPPARLKVGTKGLSADQVARLSLWRAANCAAAAEASKVAKTTIVNKASRSARLFAGSAPDHAPIRPLPAHDRLGGRRGLGAPGR